MLFVFFIALHVAFLSCSLIQIDEFDGFGAYYFIYVFFWVCMSEFAIRGFTFQKLLEGGRVPVWMAYIITSVFYLMFVYGNGRPYTFMERTDALLGFDCISKFLFSLLMCAVYQRSKRVSFCVLLSAMYYVLTGFVHFI
ncbi:hypothetical protein DTO96_101951 [Ephemeroptericola cinctiostellae]|uniref:CAAX prenyl protease 2/Lysostaphin resistance protein A-like domain-containing protein n=2 Tax=Ephemeroptericola cinctiostellae TaxID=2268024 RepID=A0A345DCW7_9BURK|nr:hypothetical protein DTO96_101951 [Ephemeroptericola cinctiostellae]